MTLSVTIGPTGISAPTYSDILTALKNSTMAIYGSDIYLGNDAQDLQMLAVFAQAIKDNNDAAISVYNSYSPATAQGVGLSQAVKINGLRRLVPSNSQVDVQIVGVNGTPIIDGLVGDNEGLNTQWALPPLVTIPGGGTITVTATCTTPGAVNAPANTITKIITPTAGWQSVNNAADGTPGEPVEDDATLRQRQSVSTALPALSVIDAILGGIETIAGVIRATIYENSTGAADGNGVPAHSIAAVVEGGDAQTIANTIQLYKTPGTGTYGTTSETVVDQKGLTKVINFFLLSLVQMSTVVELTPLAGFVSTTNGLIQGAMSAWFNALAIGEDSYINRLWSPANLSGDAATSSSGKTQAALDALSATYNLTGVFQARPDMVVTGGPYNAGATVINITNPQPYANGVKVLLVLDDLSLWPSTVTNVAGTAITIANAIPAGRHTSNGQFMYAASDIVLSFIEAADGTNANCDVVD